MPSELEAMTEELDILKRVDYIIVEGKKDTASLQQFGISNIISLAGPIFKVCESIVPGASVAILTDLDGEGKKLYSRIKEGLTRNGIKVDDRFRRYLFKRTDIRHIEGLARYVSSLSS